MSEESENHENGFRHWCIVELFGHQVIAGLVSEQQLGGASFVRVDVPETPNRPPYTKLFGASAIYAITPTDETTARQAARNLDQPPVNEWRLRDPARQLPMSSYDDDELDD